MNSNEQKRWKKIGFNPQLTDPEAMYDSKILEALEVEQLKGEALQKQYEALVAQGKIIKDAGTYSTDGFHLSMGYDYEFDDEELAEDWPIDRRRELAEREIKAWKLFGGIE